ncbi:MAG: hypothetical protein U5R49_04320 [Deltaproteobacteria bacterium]|nr:hypothetical protein [Deltaproteobacteria bacterium]
MASFDPTIPPGGEGKITIKVHTSGYEGSIYKSALVNSNDPEKNAIHLSIKAVVKPSVLISPRYVDLRGKAGQNATKIVKIDAALDKPLSLIPGKFSLKGKMTYRIKEVKKGRSFEVYFTNILTSPQTYYGFLNLKTNYPEKPVISIQIRGRFVKENEAKKTSMHLE